MEKNWMELLTQQNQVGALLETNSVSRQYGLVLTSEDAKLLATERGKALREQKRVEFGEGITPKIIREFCDSVYIDQQNYVESIVRLQEIFYLYKNEMLDEITDDELLHFMKEQFETVCCGDFAYLEETCLDIFAQAIRAGYEGFRQSEGRGVYEQMDEVPRWDYALYHQVLSELI